MWYKHQKIKTFALNLKLQAIQILINDVQMLILCLSYFIIITTVPGTQTKVKLSQSKCLKFILSMCHFALSLFVNNHTMTFLDHFKI